jgi:hypothetical protein
LPSMSAAIKILITAVNVYSAVGASVRQPVHGVRRNRRDNPTGKRADIRLLLNQVGFVAN